MSDVPETSDPSSEAILWSFSSVDVATAGPAPARSASFPLEPGAQFGPFTIVGKLGAGGMGVVFRARGPAGRDVALKLLPPSTGDTAGARFTREAQVTATLEHPGIVTVHSAGQVAGRAFIVYELVEGCTLADRLESLDRPTRLRVVEQVARAAGHAHEHGVVHRDLKPENVLLDTNDRPRVADFGLAHVADLERLTRSGAFLGSPLAMAPEQIGGNRDAIGPPTDVWALGVLLYRCLTGTLPFNAPTLVELAAQVAGGRFDAPRKVDPTISRGLEAVCLRALRSKPERRFPNGTAFAEALVAAQNAPARSSRPGLLLAGAGLAALALAGWALLHPSAATPHPAPELAPEERERSRSRVEPTPNRVHVEAVAQALAAVKAKDAMGTETALMRFTVGGPPSSPTDYPELTAAVTEFAIALLDLDPERAVFVVEALAATGLWLQEARLGTNFVGVLRARESFSTLGRDQCWRATLAAVQLDFAPPSEVWRAMTDWEPSRRPQFAATLRPYVEFVVVSIDASSPGDNAPACVALEALVSPEPPPLPLGPRTRANALARVARSQARSDVERALDTLRQAEALDPLNPIVQRGYCSTLLRAKQSAEAVRRGLRAAELLPNRVDPLLDFVSSRKITHALLEAQIAHDDREGARKTWSVLNSQLRTTAAELAEEHPWLREPTGR